jgi:hypothetical protein
MQKSYLIILSEAKLQMADEYVRPGTKQQNIKEAVNG